MCFYGLCLDLNCEKCKPKLVICPNCKKKTYIQLDKCMHCRYEIPQDVKEDARNLWEKKRKESI